MGLFKKERPKLQEVQVSEKNVTARIIAVVLLLIVGLACIAYFLYSLFYKEPGWITIEADETVIENEFLFNYNIGQGELSAADEHKQLTSLYTEESMRAYRLFDIYQTYDGVVNLCQINDNPNVKLTVDPILYRAFELVGSYDGRMLYLAPIYSVYRNLFSAQNEVEARLYDPYFDEETRAYFDELLDYTGDPSMIELQLLGDGQIMLCVSEEYLRFAEEYGITEYVDFAWLANAFVVDHVADVMISRGFTKGNLSSYDGFTRNFDDSGEKYAFNIFDRAEKNVYPAAVMDYEGATAFVFMRNYPMSTQDELVFYAYTNGTFASRYVDTETGCYKSALNNMVTYSHGHGCAEVALNMAKLYIADSLDSERLAELRDAGMYSVWVQDCVVRYHDDKVSLRDLYADAERSYQSALQ